MKVDIMKQIFYEYGIESNENISRKSKITEEKLQEFEHDVKENKEIDIKDYVNNDYVDYSSSISKIGSKLSTSVDNFLENGLNDFFSLLSKLFT